MGGRALRLHSCPRKPCGYVVGESGGAWLLIGWETPFSPPRRSGDRSLEVTFDGRVLAGNISHCPYCGEPLLGQHEPAGCYVLESTVEWEWVADDASSCWETLSGEGGEG